ncbi:unnamed protein product [Acanthoscelides obtectus]|uniref:Uncharacterized protein n=1 Tax=Acanthoscelides obtectus TaxID=200917 RepID=A0A9P0PYD2_ACAOB|nr:unnamed protein product [Acanthoscelides obtectus]CAK1680508.1 hypothetical protein AOBTE_LOCUS32711 [Acanthoscelides obtectus]
MGSIQQSAFEKTDMYVFDKEAVEETSISITTEDAYQYHTSSTSNDQVQTTVNLNKDPALLEINDTLREIMARYGFDQNKSCDFSKSEKIYADQRRFLPVSIFQRKMKYNEVKDRNWLVCSESKNSVLAFGPLQYKTQFENEGFNDWTTIQLHTITKGEEDENTLCFLKHNPKCTKSEGIYSFSIIACGDHVTITSEESIPYLCDHLDSCYEDPKNGNV